MTLATSQQVLDFWFEELTPKQWFIKSDDLDRTITERFGETLAAAARCRGAQKGAAVVCC